jgi:hypothetical protein
MGETTLVFNKVYYNSEYDCYGILDTRLGRIFWVNEDLSPKWSQFYYGQKAITFDLIKSEVRFAFALDFNYEHVTDLNLCASLD